jgi:NADH-quinone oxidoreductase subunit M
MSLLLILLPFLTSIVLLWARPSGARMIALGVGLANLGITLAATAGFQVDGSLQHVFSAPWIAESGLYFSLGMDGISLLLLLLTNLLTPLILLSVQSRNPENETRFFGLILMMLSALNGVFLATDGMLFYVFYEMALIPIYFIAAFWGGENRIRITLKFFIYTFIGSLFMLVALRYLYLKTPGNHSFAFTALLEVPLTATEAWWILLAFFLAFAVKMPVFPFHTWQPDTYVVAPTGGTMLLSGIMLKMGVYGAIRWMMPMAPEAWASLAPIFMTLAVIGIVYGSLIAVKQTDLKRLIAYSSISHVGLIAAGVFAWNTAGLQGSLIQMFNHGINVVGLFYIVDIIERRLGTRTLQEMGGIAKSAPTFAVLFMIILLGAVAVPLTNGFPGEFLLLKSVWQYHPIMGAIAGLTIIFGAVYMLRAYGLAMFGPTTPATAQFAPLDWREKLVLGVIGGLVLLLGFFPNTILHLTEGSVHQLMSLVQF